MDLNIILRLTDKLTAQMETATKSVQKFSKDIQRTGSQIQRAGMNIAFLGAAITGPLALAFKNASKGSFEMTYQLERLSNVTLQFQKSVAQAMIPVVDRLTRLLGILLDKWKSLSPEVRQIIVQSALITGIFLTLGGVILMLTGRLLKMGGALLGFTTIHPILVGISIAVFALIYNFENLMAILNPLIITLDMVAIGWERVAQGMAHVIAFTASMLMQTNIAVYWEEQALLIENIIRGLEADIATILSGGKGKAEVFVTDLKAKIQDLWKLLSNPPKMKELDINFKSAAKSMEGFIQTGSFYFAFLSQTVQMAAAESKKFAGLLKAMRIGEAIINTATAVTRAFADFPWPFSLIVAGMMSALGAAQVAIIAGQEMHKGGLVRAHNGLAVDEVPIIAQRGEGILSRRGMGALGGAGELQRLNAGQGRGNNVTVYIQNANFRDESGIQDVFERLSFLISAKQRAAI